MIYSQEKELQTAPKIRVEMKQIRKILALFALTILAQHQIVAKTIPISVDSTFAHIETITEIKVIGYTGDSIMQYVDIKNHDTLALECKWKQYGESFSKLMKERDSSYNSLEGTFPEIGETVFMISYNTYGRNRLLFAKKENGFYRFWDPESIPLANSVFFISKDTKFKPTAYCQNYYQTETEFHCSDGFLMEQSAFEELRK
ncbi:MAG: hypothetical protein H6607_13265 [Flavobacteriales bacterium]|nr:hypothetical protein [Flavobacteriales bacterium]